MVSLSTHTHTHTWIYSFRRYLHNVSNHLFLLLFSLAWSLALEPAFSSSSSYCSSSGLSPAYCLPPVICFFIPGKTKQQRTT
ncbi:hypothetical protein B0T17DRAFT_533048 [Bombardia bombarda]|uniref:Uncharacterized protein n=1 Tax=Bombardia bombarda TaxID=252184 RepID=A0AA39WTP5_9PEZI|nr:hypothetical protein B0T17DRAFT_533048 [Bombardia bombarda]